MAATRDQHGRHGVGTAEERDSGIPAEAGVSDEEVLKQLQTDLWLAQQELDAFVQKCKWAEDFAAFSRIQETCPHCQITMKWERLREFWQLKQLEALQAQALIRNIAEPVQQERWIRLSERAAVLEMFWAEPQRMGSRETVKAMAAEGERKTTRFEQLRRAVMEMMQRLRS